MWDCLITKAPDNNVYVALHLIQCSDSRHSPQGIYSTSIEVHTHTHTHRAPEKQGRLGLKGERHTEKERASWCRSTLAPESHVSLNETVIAENKVSAVADRRPPALLRFNTLGAQSCNLAPADCSLLCSPNSFYCTFFDQAHCSASRPTHSFSFWANLSAGPLFVLFPVSRSPEPSVSPHFSFFFVSPLSLCYGPPSWENMHSRVFL